MESTFQGIKKSLLTRKHSGAFKSINLLRPNSVHWHGFDFVTGLTQYMTIKLFIETHIYPGLIVMTMNSMASFKRSSSVSLSLSPLSFGKHQRRVAALGKHSPMRLLVGLPLLSMFCRLPYACIELTSSSTTTTTTTTPIPPSTTTTSFSIVSSRSGVFK